MARRARLDARRLESELARLDRGDVAPRPAADDHDVVALAGQGARLAPRRGREGAQARQRGDGHLNRSCLDEDGGQGWKVEEAGE